jgi:hypothetical protein
MENLQNFNIVSSYGVLRTNDRGETLEVNLVSWYGRPPKIDIRYWNHKTGKVGKGLTLTKTEFEDLQKEIVNILVE